ncbi:MAG: hypothetical protein AB7F79_01560 [Steroidobacteraceae bacterium]
MAHRQQDRKDQLRRALAVEAARLMAEQGLQDFLSAKRKAAERLLINDKSMLPNNAEIEAALLEHQRLFGGSRHAQQLQDLRTTALRLMQLLTEFKPHLVGSVLSGSADVHTEITLHVFIDQTEQLVIRLLEHGIETLHTEKKLRYEAEQFISMPSFKFIAGEYAVEIVVFPRNGLRQAPLSPVDGKSMARADINAVRTLLQ